MVPARIGYTHSWQTYAHLWKLCGVSEGDVVSLGQWDGMSWCCSLPGLFFKLYMQWQEICYQQDLHLKHTPVFTKNVKYSLCTASWYQYHAQPRLSTCFLIPAQPRAISVSKWDSRNAGSVSATFPHPAALCRLSRHVQQHSRAVCLGLEQVWVKGMG